MAATGYLDDSTEYLRPWKLSTLALGIGLLIFGSFYYEAPDWDIPISLIMALCTYVTAGPAMRIVVGRHWKKLPLALVLAWFSVDGCYWIYWHFRAPSVLPLMREANFFASSALYGSCGLLWMYRGSLRQFVSDSRRFFSTHKQLG
jgi:hypothetical protein